MRNMISIMDREKETGLFKFKPITVSGTLYVPFVYFKASIAPTIYRQSCPPNNFWKIEYFNGVTTLLASPNFSYYLNGGGIRLLGDLPTKNAYISFCITPNDTPPENYPCTNIIIDNKKLIDDNELFEINAPAKYIKYYPDDEKLYYLNRLLIKIEHDISNDIDFEFFIKMYR